MISLINASQWKCVENELFTTYSTSDKPPSLNTTSKTYTPFAWIKINKKTQEIIAARDHIGQEPFYYALLDHKLIFGSTIPEMLLHFKIRPAFSKHLAQDCFLRDFQQDQPLAIETYYQGIYRIKPGHYLIIKPDREPYQTAFWSLYDQNKPLCYRDEREYLIHFGELLKEAVYQTTQGARSLAAEFSGGIDSCMIFNACTQINLYPTLYTQYTPAHYPITDEVLNIQLIQKRYHNKINHHYVDAQDFDPLVVFEKMALLFGSPVGYLPNILADNLYQSVSQSGHDILLSGAAGDELVSHSFPPQLAFPQLWQEKKWQGLWQDAKQLPHFKERLQYILQRLGYSHAKLHRTCSNLERMFKKKKRLFYPDFYKQFSEYEYGNIQGPLAHDVLMRIENEAIIAKNQGFRFAYPLLYIPLLEFCFGLPLDQKLRLKTTRWLARQYLEKHIPGIGFKTKGGAFVPNTMQKCRDYAKQGSFENSFEHLPYSDLIIQESRAEKRLLLQIRAYMLKCVEMQQR